MTRPGFVINLDTCADHRSCNVACKAKTESFIGSHLIETHTAMGGEYPEINTYFIPVLCRHCEKPSCVPACDKGVLYKREDGIVAVGDTSLCETCDHKACVGACPFKNIDVDPVDGRIGKCDMCADLIDDGQTPACARSCFSGSIFFGDFDDPESSVAQAVESWGAVGCAHYLDAGDNGKPAVYYLLSKKKWQNMEGLYSPAWKNVEA